MSDAASNTPDHEGYIIDAENAAEMARLMVQDHVVTQAMGGALPEQTNLTQVFHVLDVACGPGGWLLDLVTQYLHMQGVGVDISRLMMEYATTQAKQQGLSNVQFHTMDITKALHFADNTFDLVNGRMMTGFLTRSQWPELLQECYRITRPGGVLRFTEAEWGLTNSAALDAFTGLIARAFYELGHTFSPSGRTFGTANMLRLLLKQAGCEDIQCRASAVDFSAEAVGHESGVQNILTFHKLVQPLLVRLKLATQEELESLYAQMEKEVQADDFCAVDYFLTVWGRKGK
jgi:ubiquinone/menaquinone biosynthesis C-methylase UbiE